MSSSSSRPTCAMGKGEMVPSKVKAVADSVPFGPPAKQDGLGSEVVEVSQRFENLADRGLLAEAGHGRRG